MSAPAGTADDETPAELQDAVLTPAVVDQLFTDLALATEVHEILIKRAARGHASGVAPDLAAAHAALRDGTCLGVQIRYRYQGIDFCDTLMGTPAGVRLVRSSG